MSSQSSYVAPVWLRVFYALVAVAAVLVTVAAATGWDPLHLLGDPL